MAASARGGIDFVGYETGTTPPQAGYIGLNDFTGIPSGYDAPVVGFAGLLDFTGLPGKITPEGGFRGLLDFVGLSMGRIVFKGQAGGQRLLGQRHLGRRGSLQGRRRGHPTAARRR